MTIWILALLLIICLGLVGYNQGAIRVAMSMIGLLVSALLAMPLSPLVSPAVKGLLGAFSVKNPMVIWAISPVVVFMIILTGFKLGAFALHRQVEVYYKYKAGDLRLALWERMNKRVGACLAPINALIYLVLISVTIFVLGYWTTQMSQPETDGRSIRWVNRAANDLHTTGLDKAARAIDPMKEEYYVAGDILGIVYHNPLAGSRLSSYPPLLGLSERNEFKDIANDKDFAEMLQRQATIGEVLNHPKSQAILSNPDLLKELWGLLVPDLVDLREFMNTGKSAKYDSEPILGRWQFDPAASVAALRQSKPNLSVTELKGLRKLISYAYTKATFVATPARAAIMKDVIWIKPGPKAMTASTEAATRTGDWSKEGDTYKVSLPDTKVMNAEFAAGKLKLSGDWTPLVFTKQ